MPDTITSGSPDIPDKQMVNSADWREVFDCVGFTRRELSRTVAYMQLRPFPSSLHIALSLSSPMNGLFIEPDNLRLRVSVPLRLTANILAGEYVRDFVFVIGGSERRFAGRGKVTVIDGITRDTGQIEKWLTI